MSDEYKAGPPVLWGVWSEANQDPPDWHLNKSDAVEAAKNLVAENFGIKVHLLKAASVGTIEVPAVPVTTGEMTATKQVVPGGTGQPI